MTFLSRSAVVRYIMAVLPAALLVIACGGGGGGGGGNNIPNSITVTGTFTGGVHATNRWYHRFFELIAPTAYALDPGRVARVWTINVNGSSWSDPVVNGSFAVQAPKGMPVGFVFTGFANEYLGYLSLGNGIDSLPLVNVDNVNTIGLSTLNSRGTIVEPSHNPIGAELQFSAEELKSIAQSNLVFASLLRNLDADHNGILDMVEGRFFSLQVSFWVGAGHFDSGMLTPTLEFPATVGATDLLFNARDSSYPDTVWITGPSGSPFNNTPSIGRGASPGLMGYLFARPSGVLAAGTYKVSYKGTMLDMIVPDLSSAPSRLLVPVPSVTLNADRTIRKVNLSYRLSDGSPATLDPGRILETGRGVSLQVQMKEGVTGPYCPGHSTGTGYGVYDSGTGLGAWTEHVLACQDIPWDSVYGFWIGYRDAYGIGYMLGWARQGS